MQFFLVIGVALLGIHLAYTDGPGKPRCKDTLTPDSPLKLMNRDGELVASVTDCATLKEDYPQICKEALGSKVCCRTCKGIDTSCLDDPNARFSSHLSTDLMNCEEFIQQDPCNCKKVLNKGDKKTLVKKRCCASCKDKEVTGCNCRDYLSENSPGIFSNGLRLNSCEELARDYPELCRQTRKTQCCRSCRGVSIGCLDTKLKTWNYDGTMLDCAGVVSRDPCQCQVMGIRRSCCASCSPHKDMTGCCIDDPIFKTTVRLKMKDEICDQCTCAMLMEAGKAYVKRACRRPKTRQKCCKTCSQYLLP